MASGESRRLLSSTLFRNSSGQESARKSGEVMMRNPKAVNAIMSGAAQIATATLIAFAMIMVMSGQTMANPAMAQKTGQACAKCHTAPPALNDYGKKYKDSQKK
jgi:hypothetical protein